MNQFQQFFTGLKQGMHSFGQTISLLVNTALLLIVYLVGIGLTSIIARISRKHFLATKLSKKRTSYWTDLDLGQKPLKDHYRQF